MSQEALEEISKMYALELATDRGTPTVSGASVTGDTVLDTLRRNDPVLEGEERALEIEWTQIKDNFRNGKAKEVWQRLVPEVLVWTDGVAAVKTKIGANHFSRLSNKMFKTITQFFLLFEFSLSQ